MLKPAAEQIDCLLNLCDFVEINSSINGTSLRVAGFVVIAVLLGQTTNWRGNGATRLEALAAALCQAIANA